MSKRLVWCMVAVLVGGVALQGCAQTSDVRPAAGEGANVAMASAPTPPDSTTEIPEHQGKPVVAADTKDHFEAVAAAIRQQMGSGGRFAFVTKDGRASVDTHLDDMGLLFNQYGSVSRMPRMAQSKLLDDQNAINEVLARYDGDRVVCHDEVPVGTHFPKRVCLTLRQIQQQSVNTQQYMRENQMRPSQVGGH